MPGQGCPRGPFCLPRNNFTPPSRIGEAFRCALIAALAIFGLLIPFSSVYGQRNHFNNDLFQTKSIRRQGSQNRSGTMLGSRGSGKRNLRKNQSSPPLVRRRLFLLQRSKSDQVIDRPRLAEVIKSRDSLRLVEGDWQAITFERDTAGVFQPEGHLHDHQFIDVPHSTFPNLESLPLAVRQSQTSQQLYFYLANASPWRLRVRMRLPADASEETIKSIESLSQNKFGLNERRKRQRADC